MLRSARYVAACQAATRENQIRLYLLDSLAGDYYDKANRRELESS
jgi:hypothetical protein